MRSPLRALRARLKGAPALVVRHLFGQGIVQVLNFSVGLALLRLLSIEDYGIYLLGALLVTVAAMAADLGLAQAVNSLTARNSSDSAAVGAIFAGAVRYRRLLLMFVLPAICVMGPVLFRPYDMSLLETATLFAVVVATGTAQQSVAIRTSVLNAHHDADALWRAGVYGAATRLAMLVPCYFWPTATVALVGNLAGIAVTAIYLRRSTTRYVAPGSPQHPQWNEALRQFVVPLVPSVLYAVLQGHIATFLLSLNGHTTSIAELGALGRLAQLLGLLSPALTFFIQPHFARIRAATEFRAKLFTICWVFAAFATLILLSTWWVPDVWLFILGPNYRGLGPELPLAVAGALISMFSATLYFVAISRGYTAGQGWTLLIGIAAQACCVFLIGVDSTMDALLLGIVPTVANTVLQAVLIKRSLKEWDRLPQRTQ